MPDLAGVVAALRRIQQDLAVADQRARSVGERAAQAGRDRYAAEAGALSAITEIAADRLAVVIAELEQLATRVANPRS